MGRKSSARVPELFFHLPGAESMGDASCAQGWLYCAPLVPRTVQSLGVVRMPPFSLCFALLGCGEQKLEQEGGGCCSHGEMAPACTAHG